VRQLHNFPYCPQLFFFQSVEGLFVENVDTVADLVEDLGGGREIIDDKKASPRRDESGHFIAKEADAIQVALREASRVRQALQVRKIPEPPPARDSRGECARAHGFTPGRKFFVKFLSRFLWSGQLPCVKPSTEIPDSDLLLAYARRADSAAFRGLVDRYAGMVYGTALRRLASWIASFSRAIV
jgi:hypothetical protein